jgi:excisionase family DNA binding protein
MELELLSTADAAARIGRTVRAVQKMIESGRLPAKKIGRDYLITVADLERLPMQRTGRPPKAAGTVSQ